uniref:Uncharacterized protein n=1 Tax=Cyprinus carpio TaxID=7962 RepID=A0A8C1XB91_CYPCA
FETTIEPLRLKDWEYIIGFCDQINKELEGDVLTLVQHCSWPKNPMFHNEDTGKVRHLTSATFEFQRSPEVIKMLIWHLKMD